jgi:hypothetical protein
LFCVNKKQLSGDANTSALIGGVIGAILALLLIMVVILMVVILLRRRRKRMENDKAQIVGLETKSETAQSTNSLDYVNTNEMTDNVSFLFVICVLAYSLYCCCCCCCCCFFFLAYRTLRLGTRKIPRGIINQSQPFNQRETNMLHLMLLIGLH